MATPVARVVATTAVLAAALFAGCADGDDRAPEAAPGLRTTAPPGPGSTTVPNGPPPSSGSGGETGPYVGPCLGLPEPGPPLDWLPDYIPLPEGTYPVLDLPTGEEDFRRAVLAVPMEYLDFVQFADDRWPSDGWATSQTEVEPGEADTAFIRGDELGWFQARRVYCEESWSEILLSFGRY